MDRTLILIVRVVVLGLRGLFFALRPAPPSSEPRDEVSPGELWFEADLAGRFEIEEEQTQTELGMLIMKPRQGE